MTRFLLSTVFVTFGAGAFWLFRGFIISREDGYAFSRKLVGFLDPSFLLLVAFPRWLDSGNTCLLLLEEMRVALGRSLTFFLFHGIPYREL